MGYRRNKLKKAKQRRNRQAAYVARVLNVLRRTVPSADECDIVSMEFSTPYARDWFATYKDKEA